MEAVIHKKTATFIGVVESMWRLALRVYAHAVDRRFCHTSSVNRRSPGRV